MFGNKIWSFSYFQESSNQCMLHLACVDMYYCKGYMYFILMTIKVEQFTRNCLMAEISYSINIFLNMPVWQNMGAEKSRAYSNYKIKKSSQKVFIYRYDQ